MAEFLVHPVGWVRSTRSQPADDRWDEEQAWIELDGDSFSEEALRGLEDFSHIEVLFLMDQVDPSDVERGSRHPRGRTDWPKVGVFAQRAKNRPNRIGATICRILEIQPLRLRLEGLDAVEGTPVLDIKPWMEEFGPRGQVRQPTWSRELMRGYWGWSES